MAKKKKEPAYKAGYRYSREAGMFGRQYRRILEIRPNSKKRNEDQAVVLAWQQGEKRRYTKENPKGGGSIKLIPVDDLPTYLDGFDRD